MLTIIGSGFGRTGTVSLKLALDQLGFGPCYHMMEVFAHPEHIPLWRSAADGRQDWRTIFEGYSASLDWPACAFWQELVAACPGARVIHSERPEEEWYRSFSNTIQQSLRSDRQLNPPGWYEMVRKTVIERSLGGDADDKERVLAAYRRNNAAVRASVPADRLLIHAPTEGWAPLCAFLGVDIPDESYPRLNTTAQFQERLAAALAAE